MSPKSYLASKFKIYLLLAVWKKKKKVLLIQVPEHLSFRLFLNEKGWGGGQLPFTESLLHARLFCLYNFCIHAEVILFSTSNIAPPKTSVIPLKSCPCSCPLLFCEAPFSLHRWTLLDLFLACFLLYYLFLGVDFDLHVPQSLRNLDLSISSAFYLFRINFFSIIVHFPFVVIISHFLFSNEVGICLLD